MNEIGIYISGKRLAAELLSKAYAEGLGGYDLYEFTVAYLIYQRQALVDRSELIHGIACLTVQHKLSIDIERLSIAIDLVMEERDEYTHYQAAVIFPEAFKD